MSFISVALAFFHARKWLAELLLLAVLVGGVWWFCAHLIDVGVQRQKDADARELARVINEAHAHESKIAKDASDAYEEKLATIRSSAPLGAVRLCHTPASVPTATESPGQPHESSGGREQGALAEDPGPDIGPQLDAYGGDCAAVGARLEALQSWVRSR